MWHHSPRYIGGSSSSSKGHRESQRPPHRSPRRPLAHQPTTGTGRSLLRQPQQCRLDSRRGRPQRLAHRHRWLAAARRTSWILMNLRMTASARRRAATVRQVPPAAGLVAAVAATPAARMAAAAAVTAVAAVMAVGAVMAETAAPEEPMAGAMLLPTVWVHPSPQAQVDDARAQAPADTGTAREQPASGFLGHSTSRSTACCGWPAGRSRSSRMSFPSVPWCTCF